MFQMFTGDTQDIVSGMMDTPNREYNSAAQGRWLSPDPAGTGWNQYAYTTNPLSLIDPTGLGPQNPGYSCHVCNNDTGDPFDNGLNPELGLFGAYIAYFQSGYMGSGIVYIDVGPTGSTVGADLEENTYSSSDDSIASPIDSSNPADGSNVPDSTLCSGAGVPCSIQLNEMVATLDNGLWPDDGLYEAWDKYQYTLIDINGDPVPNVDMTENLVQLAGDVSPTQPNSWTTDDQGHFFDRLGVSWNNGPIPDNVTLFNLEGQTLYAYVNGAGFLPLSPMVTQSVFYTGGGLVWAAPILSNSP